MRKIISDSAVLPLSAALSLFAPFMLASADEASTLAPPPMEEPVAAPFDVRSLLPGECVVTNGTAYTKSVTSFGVSACGMPVARTGRTPNVTIDPHPASITAMEYVDWISSVTNQWGVNADNILAVLNTSYGRLRYSLQDQDQTSICKAFCSLMDAEIPVCADLDGTNLWLEVKRRSVVELIGSQAVCVDVNCWLAAAAEHGRLVELDQHQWYEFIGVDASLIEELGDGLVVINAPEEKRAALGGRPWMRIENGVLNYLYAPPNAGLEPVNNLKAINLKAELAQGKQAIRRAFSEFTATETFAAMDAMARSALVSNLVEVARFTPTEAVAIGLTNIVEQTEP